MTDSTKDLLVIKVSTSSDITHDTVAKHLRTAINATPVPFEDDNLSSIANAGKIKTAYKLTSIAPKPRNGELASNASKEHSLNKTHERYILASIALRGAT